MNLHVPPSFHATCSTPFGSLQKDKTERQKDKIKKTVVFFKTPYFVGFFPSLLMKKTKRQLKKVITGLEKSTHKSAKYTKIAWGQCFSLGLSFCLKGVKSITYIKSVVLVVCLFARFVFLSFFKNGEQA